MAAQTLLHFEITPALIEFRRVAGDANRFLNTQLVALQTLRVSTPISPPDLVLPWSLPTTEAEWEDTRKFTVRSSLISVADALDQYLRTLTRQRELVPETIHNDLNGRYNATLGRRPTLSERCETLASCYKGAVRIECLFAVEMLATWRNIVVHRNSREVISAKTRKGLTAASEYFSNNHGGMNISEALGRIEQREFPTLSDVSTLISSSHRLVTALDERILLAQNPEIYAVALTKFVIEEAERPSAYLEDLFKYGGKKSAGRVHALLLDNGANHSVNHRPSAPCISRRKLEDIIGVGRKRASELLGIPRPD